MYFKLIIYKAKVFLILEKNMYTYWAETCQLN